MHWVPLYISGPIYILLSEISFQSVLHLQLSMSIICTSHFTFSIKLKPMIDKQDTFPGRENDYNCMLLMK